MGILDKINTMPHIASDHYWDGKQARRKNPKVKGKKAVKQHKKLRRLMREKQ